MKPYKYTFVIFFLLILSALNIFAQTLEFNVVKSKVKLTTLPKYDFLFQHIAHPLTISVSDSSRKFKYELAGGIINETDSGFYIIPEAMDIAVLNIYEIRKNKEELVYSLEYKVLNEPKIYLRGKPTDMVLTDVLLLSGKLEAISVNKNEQLKFDVVSFTVLYKENEKDTFKSLDVMGNSLPVITRKEISKLPNGSLIYYENIKVKLTEEIIRSVASFRVTMEKTESKDVLNFDVGN
jgi:hypothetical protein